MSFWQEQEVETKALDILRDVVPVRAGNGGERPFLTAYQLAIEFAKRHPEALEKAGWRVGGAGSGKGYSLAQYLASNLARYVRDQPEGPIERVFFSNQQVNDLSFLCGEDVIHSSVTATSPTIALYRLREAGSAPRAAVPLQPAESAGSELTARPAPRTEVKEKEQAKTARDMTLRKASGKHLHALDDIARLTVADWRERVARSNESAMRKRHQYPPQEGAFLRHCCIYQTPTCSDGCFCRAHGSDGVWTLRPDLDFETILRFYGELWIGSQRSSFVTVVLDERRETRARWAAGASLLRAVKQRWSDWDGKGHSLSELASRVRRCLFCDDAFDLIAPLVDEIQALCDDDSGVYPSKLVSQLFYDIAVPFDTNSKRLQKGAGYEPTEYGRGAMQRDVQRWLVMRGLSVAEFRRLDDAPVRWWQVEDRPDVDVGAVCSRVLDKLFYG